MNSTIMILIFAMVMLMFMAFPAMKIVEWIESKREISNQSKNILTIFFTILLSLGIAIFLEFS
jgi:Na+/H+ antiporter NhaC